MITQWLAKLHALIERLNQTYEEVQRGPTEITLEPEVSAVGRSPPPKKTTPPRPMAHPLAPSQPTAARPVTSGLEIRRALRHPHDLQQAMVLKEILDKPVALRRGPRQGML